MQNLKIVHNEQVRDRRKKIVNDTRLDYNHRYNSLDFSAYLDVHVGPLMVSSEEFASRILDLPT